MPYPRPLRLLRPLLPLAAVAALAACDEGPSTVTPYMHATGTLDFLAAATRNEGPLYLEIGGTPFTAEGDGLEARLIAVMERAVQTRVLRLTTEQEAAEDPRFRLVVVFNPDKGELLAFCTAQPEGGPPLDAARVELRAGFCRGDDLLAAVDGWVVDASGSDDPRFEQLLHQVARDLFARRRNDD